MKRGWCQQALWYCKSDAASSKYERERGRELVLVNELENTVLEMKVSHVEREGETKVR